MPLLKGFQLDTQASLQIPLYLTEIKKMCPYWISFHYTRNTDVPPWPTHRTEVRVSGFILCTLFFLSKLHCLGPNQSSSSTALGIACSLILCVRREMYFNEERGRQGFCPFAPSSKYCLNRPVLGRAEFCSRFTPIFLGEKCYWMTLPLAVVCVLFSLWSELYIAEELGITAHE